MNLLNASFSLPTKFCTEIRAFSGPYFLHLSLVSQNVASSPRRGPESATKSCQFKVLTSESCMEKNSFFFYLKTNNSITWRNWKEFYHHTGLITFSASACGPPVGTANSLTASQWSRAGSALRQRLINTAVFFLL